MFQDYSLEYTFFFELVPLPRPCLGLGIYFLRPNEKSDWKEIKNTRSLSRMDNLQSL